MNSTTMLTTSMSSQTLVEFIRENHDLLKTLYKRVKLMNNKIEFIDFCKFTFYHSG